MSPPSSELAHRDGRFEYFGHRLAYRDVGPITGSVVLLVHGLLSDSSTWSRPISELAARGYRVLAPDLLGHGESDKPSHGYTLESFANSLSALLRTLGRPPCTVVGHSYGGAVAMQLAHDHPQQVERLALVAAGGLGRKVHPALRAATLPGARGVVRLFVNERTTRVFRQPRLHGTLRLTPDVVSNLARAGRALATPTGRAAFFATLDTAISLRGQRGSMLELEYIGLDLPTLIVWSKDDPVVPLSHAQATHAHLPNSRLEVFPGSTHQPHHHSAPRFADVIDDFITANPAR